MRRLSIFLLLLVAACGGVTVNLPDEISGDFDLDGLLAELTDCDALSDTFVGVIRQAAEDLDQVSEATDGRVPTADLAARIDVVVDSDYFQIAERLGCDAVAQRVRTLERIREIDPESDAGRTLIEEVTGELESRAP